MSDLRHFCTSSNPNESRPLQNRHERKNMCHWKLISHLILAHVSYSHLSSNSTLKGCTVINVRLNSKVKLGAGEHERASSLNVWLFPKLFSVSADSKEDRERGHPWAGSRTGRPEGLLSPFLGPWERTCILFFGALVSKPLVVPRWTWYLGTSWLVCSEWAVPVAWMMPFSLLLLPTCHSWIRSVIWKLPKYKVMS